MASPKASRINCLMRMGSGVSLSEKKNSIFSWQSSADLMPEKIGKWSVAVGVSPGLVLQFPGGKELLYSLSYFQEISKPG